MRGSVWEAALARAACLTVATLLTIHAVVPPFLAPVLDLAEQYTRMPAWMHRGIGGVSLDRSMSSGQLTVATIVYTVHTVDTVLVVNACG